MTSQAWAESSPSRSAPAAPAQAGTLPEEIVIKGQDVGPKIGASKPALNIQMDAFESIRPSLEPDRNLFLAQSRFTVGWRYTHPEALFSPRIIEPWRRIFGGRSAIAFDLLRQLQEVLPNPVGRRELNKYRWSLTIADEEGRVFQQFEGRKNPPEELLWDGRNSQRQSMQVGHTYSPVYKFIDPNNSPYTRVGAPIQVASIAHQETSGLVIGLDSAVLFGSEKSAAAPETPGKSLLRGAADFIKRNYADVSLLIRVFASGKDLAESQGEAVQGYLSHELMLPPQGVTVQPDVAPFPDQRVEIVVLNR